MGFKTDGPPVRRIQSPWISGSTWRWSDRLTALRRLQPDDYATRRILQQRFRKSLKEDRARRTQLAGASIEGSLNAGEIKTAWGSLKVWYNHTGNRPPKPSREALDRVTQTWETLYQEEDAPGDPLPIHVTPFEVNDNQPTEEEIDRAIRRYRTG